MFERMADVRPSLLSFLIIWLSYKFADLSLKFLVAKYPNVWPAFTSLVNA